MFSAMVEASALRVGQELPPGGKIYSDNGKYFLTLQASDGNLVLYRTVGSAPVWSNYSYGGVKVVVQHDLNFVVYKAANGVAWATYTQKNVSDQGAYLTVENTGYLSLHSGDSRVLWNSNVADACPDNATPQWYGTCYKPGTPFQYTSQVFACNASEARKIAASSSMILGACN